MTGEAVNWERDADVVGPLFDARSRLTPWSWRRPEGTIVALPTGSEGLAYPDDAVSAPCEAGRGEARAIPGFPGAARIRSLGGRGPTAQPGRRTGRRKPTDWLSRRRAAELLRVSECAVIDPKAPGGLKVARFVRGL